MDSVVERSTGYYKVEPEWAPTLRAIGLPDGLSVFEHPQIVVWRKIRERENCTLDATLPDGRPIRLHIKRFQPSRLDHAADEVAGIRLLQQAQIASTPLVGWGRLQDSRGFLITEDLAGYAPADKLIAGGVPFDRLLEPIADLAARLHGSGLHHRDLYLCHFFIRMDAGRPADLRLIDAARVRKLPRFFSRRWIVKDLAQFRYSTQALPISNAERQQWFDRYASRQKLKRASSLLSRVIAKTRWIEKHDRRLKASQPERDVSLRH
ncbi:MAG TPA: lipopolysaccharide kinase InaA family protein [Tepidisphaeraceae bacterium]|nr:lipopolysaccharide kinase InaA family protein [Tepidisphaeraceae bacterium]